MIIMPIYIVSETQIELRRTSSGKCKCLGSDAISLFSIEMALMYQLSESHMQIRRQETQFCCVSVWVFFSLTNKFFRIGNRFSFCFLFYGMKLIWSPSPSVQSRQKSPRALTYQQVSPGCSEACTALDKKRIYFKQRGINQPARLQAQYYSKGMQFRGLLTLNEIKWDRLT